MRNSVVILYKAIQVLIKKGIVKNSSIQTNIGLSKYGIFFGLNNSLNY